MVPTNTEAGAHTLVASTATPLAEASAARTVTSPPAPAPAGVPRGESSAQPSTAPSPAPEQGGKGGLARTGSNGLLAGAFALVGAGAGTAFIRRSHRAKA